ncbi:MAG: CDP-alcohol phosphatidyltransferase family protein [Muribaculaceae bacterium]|nr:CDP-alcohol phosphatidyltransferase family protein [Muribaculaceae bacterium]
MSSFDKIKEQYRNSLKSMDTEEFIDLMFYRPLGYLWALLCSKIGVTPNAITIASIFLGVGGGVLLYFHDDLLWLNYLGIFLIIWANTFDSADGQLARMTKQYSKLGRILDGMSGDFWFIAIYVAICLRTNATDAVFAAQPWLIWVIAAFAGLFHAKQASSADYYRQFHLYFLKGEAGSELDSCKVLDAKLNELSWKKDFWSKLVMFFYRNYTANQEKFTPYMQVLRSELNHRYGGAIPQSFRDAFRAKSKPLMKYTNMLTFNTRIIVLFLSVIMQMPYLYFLFELTVLNIMLIYMIKRHEGICDKFVEELNDGKYE